MGLITKGQIEGFESYKVDSKWTCPDGSTILSPSTLVQIIVKQAYLFAPPTAVIYINGGKLAINCNEVIIAE